MEPPNNSDIVSDNSIKSKTEKFNRNEFTIFMEKMNNNVDVFYVKSEAMFQKNLAPDRCISQKACLITDFNFDPAGFEIAPELIADLDPLYHLVLHTGKTAVTRPNRIKLNKLK